MEYSYRLLDPLDYLRLLFRVGFHRHALPQPAERREQIIFVIQAFVLLVVVNAAIGLAVSGIGRSFNWWQMIVGAAIGILLGVLIALLVALANDLAGGVKAGVFLAMAIGVAFGTAWGLIGGVIGGVVAGAIVGGIFGPTMTGMGGAAFGVILSLAGGVAGGALDVREGWNGILRASLVLIVGLIIASVVAPILDRIKPHSAGTDLRAGMFLLVLLSIAAGLLFQYPDRWLSLVWLHSPPHPLPSPYWTVLIIVSLYLRLPLWLFESLWGPCWWKFRQRSKTRRLQAFRWAYFDHQMLLPLPGEAQALRNLAVSDYQCAVREAVELATFSGHLLPSVAALRTFAKQDPLGVQAYLLDVADENDRERLLHYVARRLPEAPARAWEAKQKVAELSSQLREIFKRMRFLVEQSRGGTTALGFIQPQSSSIEETDDEKEKSFSEAIDGFENVVLDFEAAQQLKPDMKQVAALAAIYRALLQALRAKQIEGISSCSISKALNGAGSLISDSSRDALMKLDALAATTREYAKATSPVTQRNALLQANAQLITVVEQVREQSGTLAPFLMLLVVRWRNVLATTNIKVAQERPAKPTHNPYVYGNPVRGHLFVGREDILRQLRKLWTQEGVCPSVVLYGHRRMGKSSILQNLPEHFSDSNFKIIDFNMERVGRAENVGQLLYSLAGKLYQACRDLKLRELPQPEKEDFYAGNPYSAFDQFLSRLDKTPKRPRFIIAVDEFELLEEQIKEKRLEPHLLKHWRGTFQTYPWFIMAFAGLHTLEEMHADYWNPLFASVNLIKVGFLSKEDAWRLITQPSPDFDIDYDAEAVERIIQLTNGQPYLVQLICHSLVRRFTDQTPEENNQRERRFTVADVEAAINAPEFYRDSNAYFNGVWVQARTTIPTKEQTTVLRALKHTDLPFDGLVKATLSEPRRIKSALTTLERHDTVVLSGEKYGYTVELMRRWVALKGESQS